MIERYQLTGVGGVRLAAWEYGASARVARKAVGRRAACEAGTVGGVAAVGDAYRVAQAKGPAVVLLHGLLGRASQWVALARRLAPRYRTLALDQRGHGRSARPAGPYTQDVYAADVIAAVEQLGLDRVVLVGHAAGALTAWQCAALRPEVVAGVVLCDMRAAAVGEAGQREWHNGWRRGRSRSPRSPTRHWFAVRDPRADPARPARADLLVETLRERRDGWYPMHDPRHLLASRDSWIRDAHWDELARVACPALVVRGVDGELGRAEAQEMVRVLPRGRYAEIADAGHYVPWDQPAAFCSAVEEFLEDVVEEESAVAESVR